MSQQVTLKASRISKSFPGVKALQDVEIELHAGSIHALLGENGAGKSTLLKIVMDVLTPTSGTRSCHRNLKFGYFTQHHVDQLDMSVSSLYIVYIVIVL